MSSELPPDEWDPVAAAARATHAQLAAILRVSAREAAAADMRTNAAVINEAASRLERYEDRAKSEHLTKRVRRWLTS